MKKEVDSSFESIGNDEPEYFYDERKSCFMVRDAEERWVGIPEKSFRRHLRGKGYKPRRDKDDDNTLSEVDMIVEETEIENRVAYAGPLAGHRSGYYPPALCGNPVLITEDPLLIKPIEH